MTLPEELPRAIFAPQICRTQVHIQVHKDHQNGLARSRCGEVLNATPKVLHERGELQTRSVFYAITCLSPGTDKQHPERVGFV